MCAGFCLVPSEFWCACARRHHCQRWKTEPASWSHPTARVGRDGIRQGNDTKSPCRSDDGTVYRLRNSRKQAVRARRLCTRKIRAETFNRYVRYGGCSAISQPNNKETRYEKVGICTDGGRRAAGGWCPGSQGQCRSAAPIQPQRCTRSSETSTAGPAMARSWAASIRELVRYRGYSPYYRYRSPSSYRGYRGPGYNYGSPAILPRTRVLPISGLLSVPLRRAVLRRRMGIRPSRILLRVRFLSVAFL